MIARLLGHSLVRFGIVAVAGLGIDLALAWSLARFAGVPLPLAAFCGFVTAAAFNYLLHERWTFGTDRASAARGSLYLLALLATLASRVATVAVLEVTVLPGRDAQAPVLLLATGLSFAVNYLLSRYLVFRPGAPEESRPQ